MSKELTVPTFDYATVDKDVKGKLLSLVRDITREKQKHSDSGMEIGKAIASAHELLAGDGRDGTFSKWIASECGFSRQTAYNYLNVWKRFNKCKTILHFSDAALYALAAPSAPPQAIKAAEKMAENGHKICLHTAKALLKKHKEPEQLKADEPPQCEEAATAHDNDEPINDELIEDEPINDEPIEELTFAEQVKQANGQIESFCRELMKYFEAHCPPLTSINYQGRYDSALGSIRAACTQLRVCKYHSEPCPKCAGDGCDTCARESDFGAVTVTIYKQLAG